MDTYTLEKRPHPIPCLAAAAMLILALASWPYGYYQFLRLTVCGVGGYVTWTAFGWNKMWAVWVFGAMAVLFNPVIPVHLSREAWQPIDVLCGFLFLVGATVLAKPVEPGDKALEAEQ